MATRNISTFWLILKYWQEIQNFNVNDGCKKLFVDFLILLHFVKFFSEHMAGIRSNCLKVNYVIQLYYKKIKLYFYNLIEYYYSLINIIFSSLCLLLKLKCNWIWEWRQIYLCQQETVFSFWNLTVNYHAFFVFQCQRRIYFVKL